MKRTGNVESCGAHCSGKNLRIKKKKEENSCAIQPYNLDCLHFFRFEFKLEGWFRCIKCFLCQESSSLAKIILISYFQSNTIKSVTKSLSLKERERERELVLFYIFLKNSFLLYYTELDTIKFWLLIIQRPKGKVSKVLYSLLREVKWSTTMKYMKHNKRRKHNFLINIK